jgi:hypothetical protein
MMMHLFVKVSYLVPDISIQYNETNVAESQIKFGGWPSEKYVRLTYRRKINITLLIYSRRSTR